LRGPTQLAAALGRGQGAPERAILGLGGQDAGGRHGQLGQRRHPLGPSPEPVAPQDLLHF
jgi:hypothetical protein